MILLKFGGLNMPKKYEEEESEEFEDDEELVDSDEESASLGSDNEDF
jgi:hypothetical protein